jgi:hypothetical protein
MSRSLFDLIDKSYNVNEMHMLLVSVYNGPSPQIFSSAVHHHVVYELNSDVYKTRTYLKQILLKVKDLNPYEIKKLTK